MLFVFPAVIVFGATTKRSGPPVDSEQLSRLLFRALMWTARTHFNPLISRLTDTPRVTSKFLYQGREGARGMQYRKDCDVGRRTKVTPR